eukprot:GHVN01083376.1.p1 GENE.GHVN01083376.1~~GHVN01083376.1.p1  ORF type:complete len:825 (+),score=200.70 GHVN01083376.1:267-2741(+)
MAVRSTYASWSNGKSWADITSEDDVSASLSLQASFSRPHRLAQPDSGTPDHSFTGDASTPLFGQGPFQRGQTTVSARRRTFITGFTGAMRGVAGDCDSDGEGASEVVSPTSGEGMSEVRGSRYAPLGMIKEDEAGEWVPAEDGYRTTSMTRPLLPPTDGSPVFTPQQLLSIGIPYIRQTKDNQTHDDPQPHSISPTFTGSDIGSRSDWGSPRLLGLVPRQPTGFVLANSLTAISEQRLNMGEVNQCQSSKTTGFQPSDITGIELREPVIAFRPEVTLPPAKAAASGPPTHDHQPSRLNGPSSNSVSTGTPSTGADMGFGMDVHPARRWADVVQKNTLGPSLGASTPNGVSSPDSTAATSHHTPHVTRSGELPPQPPQGGQNTHLGYHFFDQRKTPSHPSSLQFNSNLQVGRGVGRQDMAKFDSQGAPYVGGVGIHSHDHSLSRPTSVYNPPVNTSLTHLNSPGLRFFHPPPWRSSGADTSLASHLTPPQSPYYPLTIPSYPTALRNNCHWTPPSSSPLWHRAVVNPHWIPEQIPAAVPAQNPHPYGCKVSQVQQISEVPGLGPVLWTWSQPTPIASPSAVPEPTPAEWKKRVEQRKKQLSIGKCTQGYRNYQRMVTHRSEDDPVTPLADRKESKKEFDTKVRHWRKQLHRFDNDNFPEMQPSFSSPQTTAAVSSSAQTSAHCPSNSLSETRSRTGQTQTTGETTPTKKKGQMIQLSQLQRRQIKMIAALCSPTHKDHTVNKTHHNNHPSKTLKWNDTPPTEIEYYPPPPPQPHFTQGAHQPHFTQGDQCNNMSLTALTTSPHTSLPHLRMDIDALGAHRRSEVG